MPLASGARLGAYEVVDLIGVGGMGEVYKARDTRLQRTVAVKIVSSTAGAEADRLARFEQEARAAAALNHPNILTVHEIGTHDGSPFIVSELLDGTTLRTAVDDGPLTVKKAVDFAIQICHGLATAHDAGIVHRDLKPENVFITRDGRVKILDFGLAKLDSQIVPGPLSVAATGMPAGTTPGTVLGTIGYISPEQLRGQPADERSDIFAVGVVLYEMLTSRRAFQADSAADTISRILREDPPALATATSRVPVSLERIVQRCIEKRPEERFRSAADLAFALQAVADADSSVVAKAAPRVPARRTDRAMLAWASIASVAAAASLPIVLRHFGETIVPPPVVRFTTEAPDVSPVTGGPQTQLTVSPDGRLVAFTGETDAGRRIWLRAIDNHFPRVLERTADASTLFWSPDSEHIAFIAGSRLNRVHVGSGVVQPVADLKMASGPGQSGAWSRNGTILFTPSAGTGLFYVRATGGELVRVPDAGNDDMLYPEFLDDGDRFLFASGGGGTTSGVYVGALDGSKRLLLSGTNLAARYVAPDRLIVVRDGTILSYVWDRQRFAVQGDPFPIADGIGGGAGATRRLGISQTGVLVYAAPFLAQAQLTWLDRDGKVLSTVGDPGLLSTMSLSPDAGRVAYGRRDTTGNVQNLWILDLARGVPSRLTSGFTFDSDATWSPDGKQIAFASIRSNRKSLYVMSSTGGGERPLLASTGPQLSMDAWSPDGRFGLYHVGTTRELMALPLAGEPKPFPVVQPATGVVDEPTFSPDGRWVAYNANESGPHEVYVKAFPPTDARWQISTAGGVQPRWRGDGRELYFLALDGTMMAVDIGGQAALAPGAPRALFRTGMSVNPVTDQYAVSPDGKRFLIMRPIGERPGSLSFSAILNWRSLPGS